jgi:hypothetical protein
MRTRHPISDSRCESGRRTLHVGAVGPGCGGFVEDSKTRCSNSGPALNGCFLSTGPHNAAVELHEGRGCGREPNRGVGDFDWQLPWQFGSLAVECGGLFGPWGTKSRHLRFLARLFVHGWSWSVCSCHLFGTRHPPGRRRGAELTRPTVHQGSCVRDSDFTLLTTRQAFHSAIGPGPPLVESTRQPAPKQRARPRSALFPSQNAFCFPGFQVSRFPGFQVSRFPFFFAPSWFHTGSSWRASLEICPDFLLFRRRHMQSQRLCRPRFCVEWK